MAQVLEELTKSPMLKGWKEWPLLSASSSDDDLIASLRVKVEHQATEAYHVALMIW
jgi:hypothetical protein